MQKNTTLIYFQLFLKNPSKLKQFLNVIRGIVTSKAGGKAACVLLTEASYVLCDGGVQPYTMMIVPVKYISNTDC